MGPMQWALASREWQDGESSGEAQHRGIGERRKRKREVYCVKVRNSM